MFGLVSAIRSAQLGMERSTQRVERAAQVIASAGLERADAPGAPASPPAGAAEVADLSEAMTSMLIAQRAFSAQLRVIETADAMLEESVRLGDRRGG